MPQVTPTTIKIDAETMAKINAANARIAKSFEGMGLLLSDPQPRPICRSIALPETLERITVPSEITLRIVATLSEDNTEQRWESDPAGLMWIFPTKGFRETVLTIRRWLALKIWDFSCEIESVGRFIDPDQR